MPRGKKHKPVTTEPDPLPDPKKWVEKMADFLEKPKNRARTAIIVVVVVIGLAIISVFF